MRTTVRYITLAITGFVTGFALVLLVGLAWIESAHADIPLVTDGGIVAASGNRADGFTLTFAAGEKWRTGSLHEELASCRGEFRKGSDGRHKCASIVRGSMREYVTLRAAGRG